MKKSSVCFKMTAVVCLVLSCMMSMAPAALAGGPQAFSNTEMTTLATQEAQSPSLPDVTCGMSPGARVGMIIGIVCVITLVVVLVAAAADASDDDGYRSSYYY